MIALPVIHASAFLPAHDELFMVLNSDVEWEERVKKRPTASYGVPYNYSGLTYAEKPMHPRLVPICDQLEPVIGFRPNNCLLNYYASGSARMGFHVDDTENLAEGTGVAIVSLGAPRTLTFSAMSDQEDRREFRLNGGSLLYIPNEVQGHWLHAVLKEPGAGPRISLTFRQVVT